MHSAPSTPMIHDPYPYGRLFNLLSGLFLCEPTAEWLGMCRDTLAHESIPEAQELKEILESLESSERDSDENLRWEFTRLFVGPYHLPCPPYESVYTSPERLLCQDAAREVQEIYLNAGLAVSDGVAMPDHVGVELGFLAALMEKAAADPSQAHGYAETAQAFLDSHVRNWVPRFAADLEAAAECPLYRALARLTVRAIRLDWPWTDPTPEGGQEPGMR